MKKLVASVMALCLGASAVTAGGPVVIEDESEVVAEKPASSVGILPILLVGVVLCAALCGGDDDTE
jgi:hypothetical protein